MEISFWFCAFFGFAKKPKKFLVPKSFLKFQTCIYKPVEAIILNKKVVAISIYKKP